MASKPPMLGGTAIKPVERHGMEAIKYFFHNPDTGEIMTRTPMSWLLITVFYVIYYSCLAAFWAICMVIFLQTVDYNEPKWQTDSSIIGKSPGLGLRPKQSEDLVDSAIIMFNKENKTSRTEEDMKTDKVPHGDEWKERIETFLEDYENSTKIAKRKSCTAADKVEEKQACNFPVDDIKKACGDDFGYGKTGAPCIFLKLNKIYGLTNEPIDFDKEDPVSVSRQDPKMSDELEEHIKKQTNKDQVWVDCQGKYPADKEALEGRITYVPESRGLPNFYFPYQKQDDYVSPLVAVKFNPRGTPGQLIHIECRAWAENIGYNRRDKVGISVFELQVMDQEGADSMNHKEK